jgi:hypothetical protein
MAGFKQDPRPRFKAPKKDAPKAPAAPKESRWVEIKAPAANLAKNLPQLVLAGSVIS